MSGSTETPCPEKLAIDHAVGGHIVVAFVSANCASGLRSHDPIDGTMIVPSASKAALYLYNQLHIGVAVVVVTVRVVRIRIRVEDWKAKRVDEDERPIAEMAEMMRARHCP